MCFLCRSLVFFLTCHQCPHCYSKPACRGKTEPVFENVGRAICTIPKIIRILKEGYTLLFRNQQNLTSSPVIKSDYVHPVRKSYLMEALHALSQKKFRRKGQQSDISGFLQLTFLGVKIQQQMGTYSRPEFTEQISENINLQMETPESMRTSLQKSKLLMSIDFKDTYFHILINPHSREYLHFHIQDQSYQLKTLLECMMVVKEVKLMAQNNSIRIHQYLGDWMVRATSHQTYLQYTQTLVALCQELGLVVNLEKSELESKNN